MKERFTANINQDPKLKSIIKSLMLSKKLKKILFSEGMPKTLSDYRSLLGNVFIAVLILKIASAVTAFVIEDVWILGLFVPIGFMFAYLAWGWHTVNKVGNHDLKITFGDSCYYLGFLFTIASILLVLAGLYRSTDLNVGEVAIRFAAAMLTTLFGMAVRVYTVTFAREDEWHRNSFPTITKTVIVPENARNIPVTGTLSTAEPSPLSTENLETQDQLRFLLNINAENLEQFNKLLDRFITKFRKINDTMSGLQARLQHDLEENTKTVIEGNNKLIINSASRMQELYGEFQMHLESASDTFKNSLDVSQEQQKKDAEVLSKAVYESYNIAAEQIKANSDSAMKYIKAVSDTSESSIRDISVTAKNTISEALFALSTPAKALAKEVSNIAGSTEKLTRDVTEMGVSIAGLEKDLEELRKILDEKKLSFFSFWRRH